MMHKIDTNIPEWEYSFWPYKTLEDFLKARKEEEKQKKTEPFYPDFSKDVFGGVV